MPELHDFVLDLGPAPGGGLEVHVLESPAGQARGSFEPPLVLGEVRGFLAEAAVNARRDLEPHPRGEAPPSARTLGERLFSALFRGEVRDRFLESRQRAQTGGGGLRVRIRLDPELPAAAALHALPWELLFDAERREFLACSRRSPVVRYLELARPAELPPAPLPLRVLVAMANPRGTAPLALARERAQLEKIWRAHPAVAIVCHPAEEGERATLDGLRAALLASNPHVLHFMGHGGFDPERGLGVVCFENENGTADRVTGEELAVQLGDLPELRLVVLNACHSAEAVDPNGHNPFVGVATALVHGGVPAVVAMQTAISDRAAIAFSRELYHRLAAGDAIDLAVVEGRRAIGRPARTDEWATPVLFLRAREARIFAEPPAERAPVERPASWGWSPRGTLALAGGGLGAALFAALGWLRLGEHPALRTALGVAVLLAAGLAAFLSWRDPIPGRLLSHWVARRASARWGLPGVAVLAAVAWGLWGEEALCRAECGVLCPPPGVRRVVVESFDNLLPAESAGRAWAAETTGFVVQTLGLAARLQPMPSELPAEPEVLRCVDLAIRGSVDGAGSEVVLTAEVHRAGAVVATVAARGRPDEIDASLTAVQKRLVHEILRALGIAPDGELAGRIEQFPSADAQALELNRQGVVSFLAGDLFAARARLGVALARDPGYADAANNLGMVELRMGDVEAAVARFRQAMASLPRHPSYPFNLGLALDRAGRPGEAVAAYEQALALDPTHARAWNNLGFVQLVMREHERALESLTQGLAFARDARIEATLYKNLGRLALDRGAPAAALEHLEKALARSDAYPEALFYRAEALERLARTLESCAAWRAYAEVAARDDDEERRISSRDRAAALGCREEGRT